MHMQRSTMIIILSGWTLLSILGGLGILFISNRDTPHNASANKLIEDVPTSDSNAHQLGNIPYFSEQRTDSFVSSSPAHNAVLTKSPNTVQVVFNQSLAPSSSLSITNADGQPVQLGRATFSNDRMAMTTLLLKNVSGPLSATYYACTPDNQCSTGSFGFIVESPQ